MREIRNMLIKFQEGYDQKNPRNAPRFISELFADRQDLLALGVGSAEMCLGRAEVTQLIQDDWDGGWGDFQLDIDGAEIEMDGDAAWFSADSTVKHVFEDSPERNERYVSFIKDIADKQGAAPKQQLAFMNWVLGLTYHSRAPGMREYLWPHKFSGMMIREKGAWKFVSICFSAAKPYFPDERFEDPMVSYRETHDSLRAKIRAYNGAGIDDNLLRLLRQVENQSSDDAELNGLRFDPGQVAVLSAGRFMWLMALTIVKRDIPEDALMRMALQHTSETLNTNLPAHDKLFQAQRIIAYALKEAASGTAFTWPIRFTAIVENTENGYRYRAKHFS